MRIHPKMDEFHHSGSALASPESLTTIAIRSTLVVEIGPLQILPLSSSAAVAYVRDE
jgi:hypothetical protein